MNINAKYLKISKLNPIIYKDDTSCLNMVYPNNAFLVYNSMTNNVIFNEQMF